jgi:uncharacterized membrane protein YeaQ/YmgE (transglycosylase-associated protein family)
MHIIWMIIIGGVAGALAKLVMPGKDPGGIVITILLGISGAVVAGFIGRAIGWYDEPGEGAGLLASVLGAVIVLAGYRLVTTDRADAA